MIQSLARREELGTIESDYGFVIVDECHHVPAISFERCVKKIIARRWLGLTATPYRSDKLEPIITMQLGPIRHEIMGSPADLLVQRQLIVHDTVLDLPSGQPDAPIQEIFRSLVDNDERTAMVCDDVAAALRRGRRCLVLSQWTEQVEDLADVLRGRGTSVLVLHAKLGRKARTGVLERLDSAIAAGPVALIATGSFVGEGFDLPALDTLFLAFPLAFKGRLVQYVGRVLREADSKTSIEVHDYLDSLTPVLARMFDKRISAYTTLGFDVGAFGAKHRSRRPSRSRSASS
jgi:superfamily II DNA or RNA helicase